MKASVCCLTYNHGSYLEEAIQSFVSQQTSFDVEIVIGDDASGDGTFELVSAYCKKYSNIRYHRHPENIGMMANAVHTLNRCTGEFIALCEGDDYWIDTLKLEKQVRFLDENPDYALCFTGSLTRNEFNQKEDVQIPPQNVTIEELIKQNRFDTATALLAGEYLKPVPGWFAHLPFGDWACYLTVMHRSQKKAYSLKDITAVRRLHGGGAYTSMYASDEKIVKTLKWDVDFYEKLQIHLFKESHKPLIDACIRQKKDIIAYLSDSRGGRTALLSDITGCIPAKGSYILVDEWALNVTGEVAGRRVLPFTEQDGIFWGRPADDDAAIAEIERQSEKGVNAIVFCWQAFWWLEHYSGMRKYLDAHYECTLKNGGLVVFDLQKRIAPKVKEAAAMPI